MTEESEQVGSLPASDSTDIAASPQRVGSNHALPEEPPVEIHKPKPVHSWREFSTELGTIVLGICIALAGEQTITWLHWRNEVQAAKSVIASEMTYNLVGAIARMRAIGCVEARLHALDGILDAAARTGSLPPVGTIGGPPRHQWKSGAWESVVASQTAAHFPPEQLAALSSLYKSVQRAEVFATREMEAWSDLNTMVGPGRRLDSASEADLRKTLSRARDLGITTATTSIFIVVQAADMDLQFSPAERDQLAYIKKRSLTAAEGPSDDASTGPICAPIGAVPANYGEQITGRATFPGEVAGALAAVGKAAP